MQLTSMGEYVRVCREPFLSVRVTRTPSYIYVGTASYLIRFGLNSHLLTNHRLQFADNSNATKQRIVNLQPPAPTAGKNPGAPFWMSAQTVSPPDTAETFAPPSDFYRQPVFHYHIAAVVYPPCCLCSGWLLDRCFCASPDGRSPHRPTVDESNCSGRG